MNRRQHYILNVLFFVAFVFAYNNSVAQSSHVILGIVENTKDTTINKPDTVIKEITLDDYTKLYSQNPDFYYSEYIKKLIEAKKYKIAEKIIENKVGTNRQNPKALIDLGNLYHLEGKDNRANEVYNNVLQYINGDNSITLQIANAFISYNKIDYAILTYERASDLLGNPYIYSAVIAKLYAQNAQLEKAIDALLKTNPGQFANTDNIKSILLEILNNDPAKLQVAQKTILKKLYSQPDNVTYAEILTWIYTQKNDWDGALMQLEAIDERNKETGLRLLTFARTAVAAKQYDAAVKAFDDIIVKGKTEPYYTMARSEKLNALYFKLKGNPQLNTTETDSLIKQYEAFFIEFPRYFGMQVASDYAEIEAEYADNILKGIEILKKSISQPDIRKNNVGVFKLQLGDYYLLMGKIWDASLTYSQVDKEFFQDAMGEDARFRNAKLAYYRGDFVWAQRQLLILKSSTSDLIANDALYLSVLITENVEDSNYVPLERFSKADLLLYQNKDKEAEALLDSINKAFPEHPLNDDILMLRAKIAEKHIEYDKALTYLSAIHEKYGKDVLGDDAVFKMAEIYQNNLHNKEKAKYYYEQLIIEYPGSTFVQAARQILHDINNPPTP